LLRRAAWAVPVVLVTALAFAWLARRPTAPVHEVPRATPPPASTVAPSPTPAPSESPRPSATATPVVTRVAAVSAFPQLHTHPRRTRADAEKKQPKLPKGTLYESKEGTLIDTADPAEVPFEGDFPKRGTFSFWLNPVWDPANQDDASFVTVADGRLRIVKNVSFLRFEAVDANGLEDGLGFRLADWQAGEWHFVTATWDGSLIGLYVDGVLIGQKDIPSLDLPADASVTVGSLFPPGRPIAPGMMSGFRFRSRPLESGLIGREFQRTMPPPIGDEGN
jgi:hypothetical protein